MSDHRERVRKVDVSKMNIEQADNLSKMIGAEIARLMDECNSKCNEMLNIYGMQTQIHYKIVQIAEKTEEKQKTPRRKKKDPKAQSLDKSQE